MGSGPRPDLAHDLWRRADLCNSRLTPIRLIQITLRGSGREQRQTRHNNNSIAASLSPHHNLQQHQHVIGLIGPRKQQAMASSLKSNWKSLSLTMLIMALVLFEERSHRPDPFAGTLTSFIRRMKPVRLIILRWVKWAICKMNYSCTAQPSQSAKRWKSNLKQRKENKTRKGLVMSLCQYCVSGG